MNTINTVKLRNLLRTANPDLVIDIRNVRINGNLQGCVGFVTDPRTGRVVYVSTDRNHGTISTALVRVARDTKDYTGGRNHHITYTPEAVAHSILSMLKDERAHALYLKGVKGF